MLHALVTVVQEAAANEAAGSSIGLIGAGLAARTRPGLPGLDGHMRVGRSASS